MLQDGKVLLSEQRTPARILRVPTIFPHILQRLLTSCVQLLTCYSWIMLVANSFIHKYVSEFCSMKFSKEKSQRIAAVGFVFISMHLTKFDFFFS